MKRKFHLHQMDMLALNALKTGETAEYDTASKENDGIMENIFQNLMKGISDYAYIKTGWNLYLYTRSVKKINNIQKTCFWRNGNDLDPLSDRQYGCFHDLIRDGYPEGCWIYECTL